MFRERERSMELLLKFEIQLVDKNHVWGRYFSSWILLDSRDWSKTNGYQDAHPFWSLLSLGYDHEHTIKLKDGGVWNAMVALCMLCVICYLLSELQCVMRKRTYTKWIFIFNFGRCRVYINLEPRVHKNFKNPIIYMIKLNPAKFTFTDLHGDVRVKTLYLTHDIITSIHIRKQINQHKL